MRISRRQRRVGAGTHVQRLGAQPDRVPTDHRSQSLSQAAQSRAAAASQTSLTTVPARCSSMRISPSTVGAGNANGMKVGGGIDGSSGSAAAPGGGAMILCSASMTHLRSMLAFRLCTGVTVAMDTPGLRHSSMTAVLNSALCRRRMSPPPTTAHQIDPITVHVSASFSADRRSLPRCCQINMCCLAAYRGLAARGQHRKIHFKKALATKKPGQSPVPAVRAFVGLP